MDIFQGWHWSVTGIGLAGVFVLLALLGKHFGVSSTFEQMCSLAGAGRLSDYFKQIDLKANRWRVYFLAGAILGGFIAKEWLSAPVPVAISEATIVELESIGISYPESDNQGRGILPTSIANATTVGGVFLSLLGGFLIGFGARYGKGCTSGHAITGLAHLNLPSLITVIGFFIGGLIMTWWLFPLLVNALF